ncbi:MAG: hypothetical protein QXI58_02090 [Candidatus Micrarchaeia archaeon]
MKFEIYSEREIEIKNFFLNVIKHKLKEVKLTQTSDEITEEIGEEISKLENYEDWYKRNFNVEVDFWCGYTDKYEIYEITEEILKEKKVKKCKNCLDLSEKSIRITSTEGKEEIVTACTRFISYSKEDNSILISEDERVVWKLGTSGNLMFGASIYDENNGISSVIILEEGVKIS